MHYRIREVRTGNAVHYQIDRRWLWWWINETATFGDALWQFEEPLRLSSLEAARGWIATQTAPVVETVVWED